MHPPEVVEDGIIVIAIVIATTIVVVSIKSTTDVSFAVGRLRLLVDCDRIAVVDVAFVDVAVGATAATTFPADPTKQRRGQ